MHLSELLTNDDTEANELLEKNHTVLQQYYGEDSFGMISDALRSFDFESALKILKEHRDNGVD